MSSIAEMRPRFSLQEAAKIVFSLFGISGTLHALPSERDQNFLVVDKNNKRFVFKISGAAEKYDVLDLQHSALDHLSSKFNGTTWPLVCKTQNGERIEEIIGEGGLKHFVRMLTFVEGRPFYRTNPQDPTLLNDLGIFLGRLTCSLANFSHREKQTNLIWNMENGPSVIQQYLNHIPTSARQELVMRFCKHYEKSVVPNLSLLPRQFIHNDANDQNILVRRLRTETIAIDQTAVTGLIDFGDITYSCALFEPAVAIAYIMLGKRDPLLAATNFVKGYHTECPLTELDLKLLYSCATMRLSMSVCISAFQQIAEPDNTYLSVSEKKAWDLLEKLDNIPPVLAEYHFREACDLSPSPLTPRIESYLKSQSQLFAPVMGPNVDITSALVFDLSVGSAHGNSFITGDINVDEISTKIWQEMKIAKANVAIGRYNEPRLIYTTKEFELNSEELPEKRTIHLGLDLFRPAGSPVFAPLKGKVHSFQNNSKSLDYGPCIILEHSCDDSTDVFFTLYGHLSIESLNDLYEGKNIDRGEQFATLGVPSVNGGWPPHLHFQIITDLLGHKGNFPGVGGATQRNVWLSLSPDPNLMIGIPPEVFPPKSRPGEEILLSRKNHIGSALSVSYQRPLKIVRGLLQYLYDDEGRAFLDSVNNVAHVGHCHPKVNQAGQNQMAILNTNTRYLHDNLVNYAEQLCERLPDPLSVCFFVNSGSEANDLALRLSQCYTRRHDLLVLDGAYHGNLSSLIDISPYKFDGPGGNGPPHNVHKLPLPDPYRGSYKGYSEEAGIKYANHVQDYINLLARQQRDVCAFIAESLPGCGGQIVLPKRYLMETFQHVRDGGGICIADEVQVGFGRVGTNFWGFETQDVVPDIVTMGKPIGNGHPLGAVITTPEIADAFDNGMEYFNTFGGNPVSCAIGLAVLEVIKEEELQENALIVGEYLLEGLRNLVPNNPIIGDVRGMGLYIGVELVLDHQTLEPANHQATYISNRMRDHGILISTDGPLHNVLKIKPPLVFNKENADYLLYCLAKILKEDPLQISP